jgi:hypothetical protein
VKAFSEAKRENTLEGNEAQESIGCTVRVIPDGVRTDLLGDQTHEDERPTMMTGALRGTR